MKAYLFADLDDTLFQTQRKCGGQEALLAAAHLQDGTAYSFCTQQQQALFALMSRETTIIPTTARSLDAFRRVTLPFAHHAILDYGGVILRPDGTPDADWLATMRVALADCAALLQSVCARLQGFAQAQALPARVRVIEDFGMPLYVVAKDRDGEASRLAQLRAGVLDGHPAVLAGALRVHCNDNNLAVLPRALDKVHAVRHLIAQLRAEHGPILTFGLGDSHSDAAFIEACDYAIVPPRSQLRSRLAETLAGGSP